MRRTAAARRSLPLALVGGALVLVLGACSTGEDGQGDSDQQSERAIEVTAQPPTDADTETSSAPGAEVVEAARAGLGDWLEANHGSTSEVGAAPSDCPALEAAVLEGALADAGYPDTTLAGWGTEIEWSEYEQLHPDLVGVSCGGDSDGDTEDSDFGTAAGVLAVDLAGRTTYEEFTAALGLEGLREVDAPGELGGLIQTSCFPDGPDFCAALWHRDGLVVGVSLIAEGVEDQAPADLLVATLPAIVDNLAAAGR